MVERAHPKDYFKHYVYGEEPTQQEIETSSSSPEIDPTFAVISVIIVLGIGLIGLFAYLTSRSPCKCP